MTALHFSGSRNGLIQYKEIQRMVYSVFSIWKGLRKKRSDKRKGKAELIYKKQA